MQFTYGDASLVDLLLLLLLSSNWLDHEMMLKRLSKHLEVHAQTSP